MGRFLQILSEVAYMRINLHSPHVQNASVVNGVAASAPGIPNYIDAGGVGIEEDPSVSAFQLRPHVRDFLLQREFVLSVVGAFAQHECLDDPNERVRRQVRMRHRNRLLAADDDAQRQIVIRTHSRRVLKVME
jgi:hypothetical protein